MICNKCIISQDRNAAFKAGQFEISNTTDPDKSFNLCLTVGIASKDKWDKYLYGQITTSDPHTESVTSVSMSHFESQFPGNFLKSTQECGPHYHYRYHAPNLEHAGNHCPDPSHPHHCSTLTTTSPATENRKIVLQRQTSVVADGKRNDDADTNSMISDQRSSEESPNSIGENEAAEEDPDHQFLATRKKHKKNRRYKTNMETSVPPAVADPTNKESGCADPTNKESASDVAPNW